MTPKEALEGIKQRINYSLHKPENVDTKERQQRRIDKSAKQISVIEQALTELEELKRDVKRFIDLYHSFEEHGLCGDEADEFLELEVKLEGKEHV